MAATAGSALAGDALKVSARLLREVPLPKPGPAWDVAADLVDRAGHEDGTPARSALLAAAGDAMCRAYGVPVEPVRSWWSARLPRH
jgi:hypothetical protein